MGRQRVLLTGGSGLLALNWACAIRERHDVVLGTHQRKVDLAGTRSLPLLLDESHALLRSLEALEPDIVVHTAGITSVDECERTPHLAQQINADLSRNVATAARHVGARLVHISTDHLFAGTRSWYTEQDAPGPLNVYGRTKLLAEKWVAEEVPDALIVRTNFFGWGHRYRQSFSDWIYYGLSAGTELTMFDDVFITPILTDRLALSTHRLLELGASGVYNIVGDERISKYHFGVHLASLFHLPESLVRRGKIATSHLSARRPPDMSLDNRKARERLQASLGNIAEYFLTLQQQDRSGRRRELMAAVTE
jgi:dTDP-4-dehydrorhamnose reductase